MRYGRRLAAATAVSVVLAGSLAWAVQGRTLKVTVSYTGSGEVDATHAIHLSIWDTPDFASLAPIDTQVVTENGGSASFGNVPASPVYVTALYDEQGGWDGLSAPSGMPASTYSTDGYGAPAAIEVGDGQTVEVEVTFDDAFRLP